MKIFVLRVRRKYFSTDKAHSIGFSTWSDVHSYVIIDTDEGAARKRASKESQRKYWLKYSFTSCRCLGTLSNETKKVRREIVIAWQPD